MAPPTDLATVLQKIEEMGKKLDTTGIKTDETNRKIEEMQQSIQRISDEQGSVMVWKPNMESKVTDLQNSVFDLKTKVDLFIHQLPSSKKGEDDGSFPEAPTTAHLVVSAGAEASGLSGYRVDNDYRSARAGVVTTLVPPPVKGAI